MSVVSETGVLLGVAEVKVPLKNLSEEERQRMVQICYRKLLELDNPKANSKQKDLNCIGVVDSFYALQEVTFSVVEDVCCLMKKQEVILQHTLSEVISVAPAFNQPNRIIILSRTQNFGRTAVVLQMHDERSVGIIFDKLGYIARKSSHSGSRNSNGFRRGADSVGKAMGRKVNNFLSTIGGANQTDKINQEKSLSASTTPLSQSDEDDIDSDIEDTVDSEALKNSVVVTLPPPEKKPNFHKSSISQTEAEIEYLLQSEEAYVESLMKLELSKSILCEQGFMKKDHCELMFRYIEELHDFHREFMEELRCCKTISFVSSAFLKYYINFKIYVSFIGNIPTADRIYYEYLDQLKLHSYPLLGEDLRKPRMRLNFYVLTLESLLKKSDGQEREDIQKVIDAIKVHLKEADTRLMVDSVQKCPFNLFDYGFVVMQSELSIKKGEGLIRRRYQVLLLESLLVISKGTQELSDYIASFNLDEVEIVHQMRGLLIHLRVKPKLNEEALLLILKARSIKLQQKWLEALHNRIQNKIEDFSISQCVNSSNFIVKSFIEEEETNINSPSFNIDSNNSPYTEKKEKIKNLPPLNISSAFPNIDMKINSSYSTEDIISFIGILQISEELLLEKINQVSNKKQFKLHFEQFQSDLKDLYELHLNHFRPVIFSSLEKFNEYIFCHRLEEFSDTFRKTSENIIFLAAVISYEINDVALCEAFEVIVRNFFNYRKFVYMMEYVFGFRDSIYMESVEIVDETLNSANLLLKRKYVKNFNEISQNILQEGFLHVQDVNNTFQDMYVVLTDEYIYFIAISDESFVLEFFFSVLDAKFGPTPSIQSFQIIFHVPGQGRLKYNLTASNIKIKNNWIRILERKLMGENSRRKLKLKRIKKKSSTPTEGASGSNLPSINGEGNLLESSL